MELHPNFSESQVQGSFFSASTLRERMRDACYLGLESLEKARLKKQRGKMTLVSRRAYLGKVKVVKPEKVRSTYLQKTEEFRTRKL